MCLFSVVRLTLKQCIFNGYAQEGKELTPTQFHNQSGIYLSLDRVAKKTLGNIYVCLASYRIIL